MSSKPFALVVRILAYCAPWYLFPFSPFILRARFGVCFLWVPFFLPWFPVRRFGISLWCFKRSKEARYRFKSWCFRHSYFFHCALVLYLVLMTCPILFFSKKIRRGDRLLRWRWIQSVDFIWTYSMGYCRQMRAALKGWMEMIVKDNPRDVLAISVAKYILLGESKGWNEGWGGKWSQNICGRFGMALNGKPPSIVITDVFNCIEICILFFYPGLMTISIPSRSLSLSL